MIRLDRLSYEGEECIEENCNKPISRQQEKVLDLIKKYFNDEFNGGTFGEAWDFIKKYIRRTYIDRNGNEKTLFVIKEKRYKSFLSFQDIGSSQYFNMRHKAMLRGEDWSEDDRFIDDEAYYLEQRRYADYDDEE